MQDEIVGDTGADGDVIENNLTRGKRTQKRDVILILYIVRMFYEFNNFL